MNTIGRMRNVYGDLQKEKIEDIRPCETTSEGQLVDANNKFLLYATSAYRGSAVAVFDAAANGRIGDNAKCLRGHIAPVCDVRLSPMLTNICATGSDDATVKIWNLSEKNFTADCEEYAQSYTGHIKKITSTSFNPSVSEIICSTSFDGSMHVWNIVSGDTIAVHQRNEVLHGCDWNFDGSMVGFTTKERNICIFDPRKNEVAMEVNAFDGNKIAKMNFMGNSDYVVCISHSKNNDRQIKLFDMKKFDTPLQSLNVDHQSYSSQTYYDSDTNLYFIPGRGESTCKYFELVNGSFKKAAEYTSSDGAKSSAFVPKRFMNYNKCELNRMVKLTKNWVGYVNFYYPKKVEQYDPSLYPDCLTGEASNTVEEWTQGKNVDPVRKPIDKINPSENTNTVSFGNEGSNEDKIELKKENDSLMAELEGLKKQLETHKMESESLQKQLTETQAKNDELTSLNQGLTEEVAQLKEKLSGFEKTE